MYFIEGIDMTDGFINAEAIEVVEQEDVSAGDGSLREHRIVAKTSHHSYTLWAMQYYPDERTQAARKFREAMDAVRQRLIVRRF